MLEKKDNERGSASHNKIMYLEQLDDGWYNDVHFSFNNKATVNKSTYIIRKAKELGDNLEELVSKYLTIHYGERIDIMNTQSI
jgi:hypothetical protein